MANISNLSPNMRNMNEAALYTGVGILEYTNVSVGRGTDTPFEVFGAPWIKPRVFARYMNARQNPGCPIRANLVYTRQSCQVRWTARWRGADDRD